MTAYKRNTVQFRFVLCCKLQNILHRSSRRPDIFRTVFRRKITGGSFLWASIESHKLLLIDHELKLEAKRFGGLAAQQHTLHEDLEVIHD